MAISTLKPILIIYLILFSGFNVWRIYRVWKKTGIYPVRFSRNDDVYSYIGNVLKIVGLLGGLSIVLYAVSETAYSYSYPIPSLESTWSQILGLVLMLAGLVLIVVAQAQMRESWRIGIDQENKTDLVYRGLYKYSRNPIYLGILIAANGLFLVTPNFISMLVVIMGDVAFQVQIRLEEGFLYHMHGDKFLEYCQKVRRWL